MPNNPYWKKRMELLEEAQLQKGQVYYANLEKQYMIATKNIEKEISTWYTRFAVNNKITMAEAKRLLNTRELKEFKWDVDEYIKYGEKNAMNPVWMKELENASAKVHISRLESLKLQMQQQVEVLYGNQQDGLDKLLRDVYSEGYYHTAWEIQKGFNVGWDLQDLDSNQLNMVLSKPWSSDKRTFSDRLWTNKQQLIGTLQTQLAQSVIRGQSPDQAIKDISHQFNVDKNKAGRLVMTESAAFASASQKDCFNALDVERFEIVATLDNHTSEICQELDGQIFDMKEFEVGVTAPPFHCWCRTTTVPHFEDDYGERAARGKDGKTYYVPSTMKYKDWKQTFIDGGSKDGLKQLTNNGNIKSIKDLATIEEVNEFVLNALNPLGIVKVDFSNLDLKLAQENGEQLISLQNKYQNTLNCVQSNDCGNNVYAHVVRVGSEKTSVMELSPRYFKDSDRLEKSYTKDVNAQFHPKGTEKNSSIAILTHEFGHTFSSQRQSKQWGFDSDFWNEIESVKRKYSRALTALDKKWHVTHELTYEEWKEEVSKIFVSEYAKKNADEFLAESFAMAELSDEPSPFALEVLEIVKKYFTREGE